MLPFRYKMCYKSVKNMFKFYEIIANDMCGSMYFNSTKGALRIYDNYQNVQKFFPAKNWLCRYLPNSKLLKISCRWYIFDESCFYNMYSKFHVYTNDTFETFYASKGKIFRFKSCFRMYH
jgi:hypothetical protein